jgi:spheroidene monooxygenase
MKAPDLTMLLVLVKWRPSARLWGMLRLPLGTLYPLRAPGLVFQKVLGSGQGGGFGLIPSLSHLGLFCAFEQPSQASDFLEQSSVIRSYERHADELAWLLLNPYSIRGAWSGFSPTAHSPPPEEAGPIAALTRASIRPSKMRAFWSQSPAAEAELAVAQGCQLAVGLGEAPLLRQATFSLWESLGHMDAYARSGAHLRAIQTAYRGEHFSESMFVRFKVMRAGGVWKGASLGTPSP